MDVQHKKTRIITRKLKMQLACLGVVLLAAELVTCNAVGGESLLAPAVKAIEAGDFGGEAVTRAQLEQYLPTPKPHPAPEPRQRSSNRCRT